MATVAQQERELAPPRPRRWNRDEYYRMADAGILGPDERVELLDGRIYRKYTGEPRRWTREEYYRLAEAGILRPEERVELVDGEIWEMSPQNPPHSGAVRLAAAALASVFGEGFVIQMQLPLSLAQASDLEPDLAVVPGSPRDFVRTHPHTAILAVEVADSSLKFDRSIKASVYAAAGIPDYWIVNLIDRQLEVHRQPAPLAGPSGGHGYLEVTVYQPDEFVAPLAAPDHPIAVADLLP